MCFTFLRLRKKIVSVFCGGVYASSVCGSGSVCVSSVPVYGSGSVCVSSVYGGSVCVCFLCIWWQCVFPLYLVVVCVCVSSVFGGGVYGFLLDLVVVCVCFLCI